MSFLVKAVLGQRVVHPPPSQPSSPDAPSSSSHTAAAADSPVVAAKAPISAAAASSPSSPPPLNPFDGSNGRFSHTARYAAAATSSPPPPLQSRNNGPPASTTVNSNSSKTPARTLIMRMQTCVVAQDLRDCLRELTGCADLPFVMASREVLHLVNLLREKAGDEDVESRTLVILSNVTDLQTYPSGTEGGSSGKVSDREKRSIRDGFLHELLPEIPLFLECLKKADFWNRVHIVHLLQRLQEHDPAATHKLLLSAQGIGVLVDVLNDGDHDGMLRKEGLTLMNAITAMDTELQTILAFENGFDALFHVVEEVGGVRGGIVASECLTVIHNMLRGNKATQKLFIEMGCARHVCSLFMAIPSLLEDEFRKRSSADAAAAELVAGATRQESLSSNMHSITILLSVSILSCVLKESCAAAGEEGEALRTRQSLVQAAVLPALAALAFSGAAVDAGIRIEALRALSMLMESCKLALESFTEVVVCTLVRAEAPRRVCRWTAMRGLLEYLFTSDDATMCLACVQVVGALWSVPACQPALSDALLRGFAASSVPGMKSPNHYDLIECGEALSCALLGPSPSVSGKYYVAHLFLQTLAAPGASEQLLATRWRSGGGTGSESSTPSSLPNNGTVKLSATLPLTFFNAFVSYVMFCLKGGNSSENMNSDALSAYVRIMLTWMRQSPKAVVLFLSEAQWYPWLLQQAGREGQVNVRLWCAAMAATVCCHAPSHVIPGGEGKPVYDRHQVIEQFVNHLGGAAFIDNLIFDVKATTPQWSAPAGNALTASAPVIYDNAFVSLIQQIVHEFKAVCPTGRAVGNLERPPQQQMMTGAPDSGPLETTSGQQQPLLTSTIHSDQLVQQQHQQQQASSIGASVLTADFPPARPQPITMDTSAASASLEVQALQEKLASAEEAARQLQTDNDNLQQQLRAEQHETQRSKMSAQELSARLETLSATHAQETHELQASVRLLEEALHSKEEEHVQLVQSLNMMEAQLQQCSRAQQQAPPPPPPPQQQQQQQEAVESVSLQQHQMEVQALTRKLEKVKADRKDLLRIVGAMDVECESLRATSAATTPARTHAPDSAVRQVAEAEASPAQDYSRDPIMALYYGHHEPQQMQQHQQQSTWDQPPQTLEPPPPPPPPPAYVPDAYSFNPPPQLPPPSGDGALAVHANADQYIAMDNNNKDDDDNFFDTAVGEGGGVDFVDYTADNHTGAMHKDVLVDPPIGTAEMHAAINPFANCAPADDSVQPPPPQQQQQQPILSLVDTHVTPQPLAAPSQHHPVYNDDIPPPPPPAAAPALEGGNEGEDHNDACTDNPFACMDGSRTSLNVAGDEFLDLR